jgi:vacuolar-type H+-ATPase subunit I/STV1
MSINLEQIKSKVSETKNQIEQSNDLSPEDKMAKAREFENVMSEINKDLESLKASATPQELKEIEKVEIEYKKLQEQLNVFKQELDDFQSSVVESVAANNNDSEIISSENDKPNRWERNKKTVLI